MEFVVRGSMVVVRCAHSVVVDGLLFVVWCCVLSVLVVCCLLCCVRCVG